MRKITYFQSLTNTALAHYVSEFQAFDRIKNGKSKDKVEALRAETNPDKAKALKNSLPCICFSGTFKTRRDSDLIAHSGLVCLDFDNVENPAMVKEELKQDAFVYAAFISPSGTGVKVVVKIPENPSDHRSHFLALMDHFNIEGFDTSSKNVSRICYESYDPEIYININSEVFTKKHEPQQLTREDGVPDQIPITDSREIIDKLVVWMEKKEGAFDPVNKGNRHNWRVIFAGACNSYGVPYSDCYNYLMSLGGGENRDADISDAMKWAYSKTAEFGRQYFVNNKAKATARNMATSGRPDADIKNYLSEVEGLKPTQAAKIVDDLKAEINNRDLSFWDATTNERGKTTITFNRYKFHQWIAKPPQLVHRYKISDDDWRLIRQTEGKRVKLLPQDEFVRIPFGYIEQLPDRVDMVNRTQIWEVMAKGSPTYFGKGMQEIMPPFPFQFQRDQKDSAFYYFQNCAVKVTKDGIEELPYDKIDNFIWESHVTDKEIRLTDKFDNDFSRFMQLVSNEDTDRFNALCSIAGYMIHNHKDKRESKMVFLYDEVISDNPEGGTGKGVFIQGLSKMRKGVEMNGKSLDFTNQFIWQRVNPDTQFIVLQDIEKNFDLEQLFSVITDGITVNKKNVAEVYIPYEYSPKLIATSNYVVKGKGNSHERRKVEAEFRQYFNSRRTPMDEFGRVLFDEWGWDDWNKFYNFMFQCSRKYLADGIVDPVPVHLGMRRFISNTSTEFVEWCASLVMNEEYERAAMRRVFFSVYPDKEKYVSTQRFNDWIDAFVKEFQLTTDHRRSGNDFFYRFADNSGAFGKFKAEKLSWVGKIENNEPKFPF